MKKFRLYVTIPVRCESVSIEENVKSFITQQEIDPCNYTLIYSIENTQDEVLSNSPAYQENVRTIKLLREVYDFNPALTAQLAIIDRTGPDSAPFKCSVGQNRSTLVEKVCEIHNGKSESAIIVTSDADTLAHPLYLKNLIKLFQDIPNLTAAIGHVDYIKPEEIPLEEILYFKIYDQSISALLPSGELVSAQAMAFRLDDYLKTTGFQDTQEGEDSKLLAELRQIGNVIRVSFPCVSTTYRYSDRCNGHGHILSQIHQSLKQRKPILFDIDGQDLTVDDLIIQVLANRRRCL